MLLQPLNIFLYLGLFGYICSNAYIILILEPVWNGTLSQGISALGQNVLQLLWSGVLTIHIPRTWTKGNFLKRKKNHSSSGSFAGRIQGSMNFTKVITSAKLIKQDWITFLERNNAVNCVVLNKYFLYLLYCWISLKSLLSSSYNVINVSEVGPTLAVNFTSFNQDILSI
jgi:hypothetical protein